MAVLVAIATLMMSLTARVGSLEFQHHSQSEMEIFLADVVDRYPDLTRLYSIGQSIRGDDLWVLVVGKIKEEHEPLRPNVKYVGNMHGNEVLGRELLLHLIDHFLTQYNTNSTIQQYLNTTFVHIMPTMNPDGYNISFEGDCDSVHGRYNANGLDLNRNFPEVQATHPNPPPIQHETELVIDWIHNTTFVLSANLHGGEEVANYPLDHYYPDIMSISPDDDTFRHLALTFSKSHHTMSTRTSRCDTPKVFTDGITNGAKWYPVYGGMQDYNYLAVGTFELTLELSCCKYPYASELPVFWEYNRDALINFLFEAHIGVKGLILDTNNNPVVYASLAIVGREFAKFRSNSDGAYFRLLMPGTYQIQATHKDYKTKSTEFKVVAGVVTRLDLVLQQADMSTLGRDNLSTLQQADMSTLGRDNLSTLGQEDLSTKSTHSAASTIQQYTSHLVWSFVPLALLSLSGLI